MEIVFIPSIEPERDDIIDALLFLFNQLVGEKSLLNISKYIITDDSHFKSVINSIDKNSNVSDNESVVEIAKTIFNPNDNKSTVIIKNQQIIPIIHGLNSQLPLNEWTEEQLDALYTSIHEIGHGIDNYLRVQNKFVEISEPFIFDKVCEYYYQIILSEVGANICATKYLPIKFKIKGRLTIIEHVWSAYTDLIGISMQKNGVILSEYDCFRLLGYIAIVLLKLQEVYIHRVITKEKVLAVFSDEIQVLIKEWIENLERDYPYFNSSQNAFNKIVDEIIKYLKFRRVVIGSDERIEVCV